MDSTDEDILGSIAIEAFAGVQRAEIERMDWSEVDLEEGNIRVKASKAKSSQNRLIPISDNIKAWPSPIAKNEGTIWSNQGRKLWEQARENAGIKGWHHNYLRHGFASYHLAHHSDAGSLALQLGYTDTKLIFSHYGAIVNAGEAEKYWGIYP